MKALFFTSLSYLNRAMPLFILCCVGFMPNGTLAQLPDDVGIINVHSPNNQCELGEETIEVTLFNYGTNPQSLIPFRFSINGEDGGVMQPTDGFYTGVLGPDSMVTVEFETTYNFSEDGIYTVAAWTELESDTLVTNDTFYYQVENIMIVSKFPYISNFDESQESWYYDADSSTANGTWEFGTPSGILINTAATGNFAWVTNLTGLYQSSELSYILSPCMDFSNFSEDPIFGCSINYETEEDWDGAWLEGTIDGGVNWVKVGAIGQGTNWYNINNTNINLGDVWAGSSGGWQNAEITLDGYMGEPSVRFRFAFGSDTSFSSEGMAVDDIFITGCLLSFNATFEIVGASSDMAADGSITVIPTEGTAPYTYTWSNGSTTDTTTNLIPGEYTVTIVDALGCTDEVTVTLEINVATEDLSEIPKIQLNPNPTSGQTVLALDFQSSVNFTAKVVNTVGQTLMELSESKSLGGRYPLDLSKLPTGMYFVQVIVDNKKSYVERMIKM